MWFLGDLVLVVQIRKSPGGKYFMPFKSRFQFLIPFPVTYVLSKIQCFIINVININIFSIKYNE